MGMFSDGTIEMLSDTISDIGFKSREFLEGVSEFFDTLDESDDPLGRVKQALIIAKIGSNIPMLTNVSATLEVLLESMIYDTQESLIKTMFSSVGLDVSDVALDISDYIDIDISFPENIFDDVNLDNFDELDSMLEEAEKQATDKTLELYEKMSGYFDNIIKPIPYAQFKGSVETAENDTDVIIFLLTLCSEHFKNVLKGNNDVIADVLDLYMTGKSYLHDLVTKILDSVTYNKELGGMMTPVKLINPVNTDIADKIFYHDGENLINFSDLDNMGKGFLDLSVGKMFLNVYFLHNDPYDKVCVVGSSLDNEADLGFRKTSQTLYTDIKNDDTSSNILRGRSSKIYDSSVKSPEINSKREVLEKGEIRDGDDAIVLRYNYIDGLTEYDDERKKYDIKVNDNYVVEGSITKSCYFSSWYYILFLKYSNGGGVKVKDYPYIYMENGVMYLGDDEDNRDVIEFAYDSSKNWDRIIRDIVNPVVEDWVETVIMNNVNRVAFGYIDYIKTFGVSGVHINNNRVNYQQHLKNISFVDYKGNETKYEVYDYEKFIKDDFGDIIDFLSFGYHAGIGVKNTLIEKVNKKYEEVMLLDVNSWAGGNLFDITVANSFMIFILKDYFKDFISVKDEKEEFFELVRNNLDVFNDDAEEVMKDMLASGVELLSILDD